MRLIDADAMKEMISEVIKKQNGKDNDLVPIKELNIFIDEQPTAYDSDNLCEWEYKHPFGSFPGCKNVNSITYDTNWKYCPFCGKKIKRV